MSYLRGIPPRGVTPHGEVAPRSFGHYGRVSSDNNSALGQGLGQHALRLSGRLVAGVGQLLLWALHGLGRLLRPLAVRTGGWLYGRKSGGTGHDGRTLIADPTGRPAQTAPLPRWLNTWEQFAAAWWFAPLTGVALTLAALAELYPHRLPPLSVAGGFAVAGTLPLVWRREFLKPVSAVVLGTFAAALLSGQQLMVTSVLAALYTLYTLGRHLDRQSTAVLAVTATAGVLVVSVVSNSLEGIPVIASVIAVFAAIGVGDARRVVETAERTEAEAYERNSQTLSQLDAVQREQAVLRERARIARELHDVVAHSVSMIAVQAETAPYTMRELSPEAAQGYQEIAAAAREALVEMRRLLGVLRADAGAEADTAPQPGLDRLPELIDKHRGAGGHAEIAVTGTPRALSATIELSAYRIVQEALTNARRHAPGSKVRVELSYLPDRLAVRVRDDGSPGAAHRGPRGDHESTLILHRGNGHTSGGSSPQGPHTAERGGSGGSSPRGPALPANGSASAGGHGLLGMRERATMLGGRFFAGPATEGGFTVEAELPTTAQSAAPTTPP